MKEKQEIDIRESMLYTLYLNMSVCYMRLKNFELAEQILEECTKINQDSSQLLYRRAMAISCNLDSPLEKLYTAKSLMKTAWDLKDTEKIYEHSEKMLFMVNLDNYKEAYKALMEFIGQRITERGQK